MRIYIIGAGGVGSWLAPAILNMVDGRYVTIIDKDILEDKNLDRQLFQPEHVGMHKAEALATERHCQFKNEWFAEGTLEPSVADWLLVCVDNHAARKAALSECDRYGCRAIFAANETHSAEAYFYSPPWKGLKLDPRVYYPDILTDRSGDPRRIAIGCTGEAQRDNPQLVTSNALAAALAGHLFAFWYLKAHKLDKSVGHSFPVKLVANMSKLESYNIGDMTK